MSKIACITVPRFSIRRRWSPRSVGSCWSLPVDRHAACRPAVGRSVISAAGGFHAASVCVDVERLRAVNAIINHALPPALTRVHAANQLVLGIKFPGCRHVDLLFPRTMDLQPATPHPTGRKSCRLFFHCNPYSSVNVILRDRPTPNPLSYIAEAYKMKIFYSPWNGNKISFSYFFR